MEKSNVILIGMPGAGKSTLGIVLAKRKGLRFVDTDLLLQEAAQDLLSDVIEERGVEGFIEFENAIIRGLECEEHVIATGGSAVYGSEAMAHLRGLGIVVYICVSFEEMCRRLGDTLEERGVVMRNGCGIKDMFCERVPLYERYADVTVDITGMDTREAVLAVEAALETFEW